MKTESLAVQAVVRATKIYALLHHDLASGLKAEETIEILTGAIRSAQRDGLEATLSLESLNSGQVRAIRNLMKGLPR